MNTIPLTFSEHQISRMELGGQINTSQSLLNISVVLLNSSGSHLRTQVLENLISSGFKSVISVEPNSESFNLEDMTQHFPTVKFIIPQEPCTDGELINMCMGEVDTKWVMVLRDSLYIPQALITKNLLENITKSDCYCIVPRFSLESGESISISVEPHAYKGHFKMVQTMSISDEMQTLFPYDYMGIYDREKFILLGGFDYTIKNPYWQNADLAIRSWLWGERTEITTKLSIQFLNEPLPVDVRNDLGYLRFYLKNLAPIFKIDHAEISNLSFFHFFIRSSCGIFEAISQFKEAKKWVQKCKYRFKFDAQYLIENWRSVK